MRRLLQLHPHVGYRCAPNVLVGERRFTNLSQVVRHYIVKHKPDAQDELDEFRHASSIHVVLHNAGMARNFSGKRFPHQWRLKAKALQATTNKLRDAKDRLLAATSFDEVFDIVQSTAGQVSGIGELYVYDTALRIGAHLRHEPSKVYLHAGTRLGARKLGLNARASALAKSEIPAPLRRLKPHEIEDILCIYKDRFPRAAGA